MLVRFPCSCWGGLSTNSLNPCSPSFWYFSLSLCFASFYFCLLIFIKTEKHWCNFAFWCNEMQLYDSATGSIKGHFKTQLSFSPFTLSHSLMTLYLSGAHCFSHLSGSELAPTFTPPLALHTQFSYPLWYCWALAYVVELAAGFWIVMERIVQMKGGEM